MLTIVGARLRTCARNGDTVARLGGDEFAVLLLDSDPEIAASVADRIGSEIARPVAVAGREVTVGASVGVAMGWAGATADDLLSEADHRMYAHKRRAATT